MVNVVVKMAIVVPMLNFVQSNKDVNQNLVNVLKEDVEKNGEHVQKDNVVVRMELVVLHQNSVHFLKDVKLNMVNVL